MYFMVSAENHLSSLALYSTMSHSQDASWHQCSERGWGWWAEEAGEEIKPGVREWEEEVECLGGDKRGK